MNELVVRGLCSVFQKLMKVAFKNLDLVFALQITKFFFLFTKNLYLLRPFQSFYINLLFQQLPLPNAFILNYQLNRELLTTNHY